MVRNMDLFMPHHSLIVSLRSLFSYELLNIGLPYFFQYLPTHLFTLKIEPNLTVVLLSWNCWLLTPTGIFFVWHYYSLFISPVSWCFDSCSPNGISQLWIQICLNEYIDISAGNTIGFRRHDCVRPFLVSPYHASTLNYCLDFGFFVVCSECTVDTHLDFCVLFFQDLPFKTYIEFGRRWLHYYYQPQGLDPTC